MNISQDAIGNLAGNLAKKADRVVNQEDAGIETEIAARKGVEDLGRQT